MDIYELTEDLTWFPQIKQIPDEVLPDYYKPNTMKNRTYIGRSLNDLIKKKNELLKEKKMVVGSSGVQFMDMVYVGKVGKWLMIYRSTF